MFLTGLLICTIYTPMKRVNYHLTDREIEALRKESEKTGISVAEIIRRLIDNHFKEEKCEKV